MLRDLGTHALIFGVLVSFCSLNQYRDDIIITLSDNGHNIIMQIVVDIHHQLDIMDIYLFCSLHVPCGHTLPGEVP